MAPPCGSLTTLYQPLTSVIVSSLSRPSSFLFDFRMLIVKLIPLYSHYSQ